VDIPFGPRPNGSQGILDNPAYTDPEHNSHESRVRLRAQAGLVIYSIYKRLLVLVPFPSVVDLWHDLGAVTSQSARWDLTTPFSASAWNAGDLSRFHGWHTHAVWKRPRFTEEYRPLLTLMAVNKTSAGFERQTTRGMKPTASPNLWRPASSSSNCFAQSTSRGRHFRRRRFHAKRRRCHGFDGLTWQPWHVSVRGMKILGS